MPIRPNLRPLYPAHWPALSAAIRFGRAGGRCERCGSAWWRSARRTACRATPLDPRHPAVRDVWAGIRRSHGTAPHQKTAATSEVLRDALRELARRPGLRPLRDRALLLVGFAAALRRAELVALDLADLRPVPEGLVLALRRAKTDQEGAGTEIALPHGHRALTCPVRAFAAWLDAAGIASGAVFVSVTKGGRATATRLSDRDVARW